MSQSQIACPACGHRFELTQAMAAPIEAQLRAQFEAQGEARRKELDARERELAAKAAATARAQESIDEQVAARLAAERATLAADLTAKAKADVGLELKALQEQAEEQSRKLADAQARELDLRKRERSLEEQKKAAALEMERTLDAERAKIAEAAKKEAAEAGSAALRALQAELAGKAELLRAAQATELALRQERAKLEADKDALKLEVQRQIDAERDRIRADAKKQADEEHRLTDAEKNKKIDDMLRQIEELKRKAEQGSQQAQGEVLEEELEAILRAQFPFDKIEPVPKGVHGGDVLQTVRNELGQECGKILWESKRTKNWSAGWLTKLRDDGRTAKADHFALMSTALPDGCTTFAHLEGVWVTNRDCVRGVAMALRNGLLRVAEFKRAVEGQQGKMELMYHYLTGPQFRQRVEAIVESFTTMQADLDAEKKALTRLWAKREKQIERAALNAVGMHGDLAGIVGRALPELDNLLSSASGFAIAD